MHTQPPLSERDDQVPENEVGRPTKVIRFAQQVGRIAWPRIRDAWTWCVEWTAGLAIWCLAALNLLGWLGLQWWSRVHEERKSQRNSPDSRETESAVATATLPETAHSAAIDQRRTQFRAGPRRASNLSTASRAAVSAALLLLAWYSLTPGRETSVTFDGPAISLTPDFIGPEPPQRDVQSPADQTSESPPDSEIASNDAEATADQIAKQLEDAERMRDEALAGLPPAIQDAIRSPDADIKAVLDREFSEGVNDDRALSRTGAHLAQRPAIDHGALARNIVAGLFRVGSDKCKDRGYRSLQFGNSINEVRRQLDIEGSADHEWLGSQEGGLYFEDGKLRGIRKVYPHDVVGYTRAATQLFGPAKKGDVFAFSGSDASGDYREETLIHYRCPHLLACVSVNTFRQRVRNLVQFTVFDREWLTQIFEAEARQRSQLFASVRRLYEHFEKLPDGWASAPEIPGTTRVVGTSRGTQGQILNFVAYRGRNAGEAQNPRYHRYYEDSVVEVIEFENRYLAIEVHGYCDKSYSPHPLLAYRDPISEPSALRQDVLRCNSMLAQLYFQPKRTTIQTKPRHDEFFNFVTIHDWETQSGWRVRIRANNVLFLIRPGPPPKL